MALTDIELQDIISNLSPEERKQLLSQLGRQVEIDDMVDTMAVHKDGSAINGLGVFFAFMGLQNNSLQVKGLLVQ